jgi:hypothetical protein
MHLQVMLSVADSAAVSISFQYLFSQLWTDTVLIVLAFRKCRMLAAWDAQNEPKPHAAGGNQCEGKDSIQDACYYLLLLL